MKKFITALLLGVLASNSVVAEECWNYIDDQGIERFKCVRDEYDRKGLWSSSQPYDAQSRAYDDLYDKQRWQCDKLPLTGTKTRKASQE